MRPEFGTLTVPVSETTRLPWFVITLPIGARNPDVNVEQSAASATMPANAPVPHNTAMQVVRNPVKKA
jgi:hypothetical protein